MRFAIVAGEPSGDLLGAGLMQALRARDPQVSFIGVGGPLMQAAGLQSLLPFERLVMNGFAQPLRRFPELLRAFRRIRDATLAFAPDAFIGVDFNVFNLLLERALKRRQLRTVHYVSPAVYAWRRGRVQRIGRSTDLMLTLFPFEAPLYHRHGVAATFVGHPLADDIAGAGNRTLARQQLRIDGQPLIALLPGSRASEIALLGALFMQAAAVFAEQNPQARFVVACLDERIRMTMADIVANSAVADRTTLVAGETRAALSAADAALVKSGTATLEAMLLERPMVVAYRLGRVTAWLVRRLLRTPYVALPNILAGRRLVPELLQEAATPQALAAALHEVLLPNAAQDSITQFRRLAAQLRRDASAAAAAAVINLLEQEPS